MIMRITVVLALTVAPHSEPFTNCTADRQHSNVRHALLLRYVPDWPPEGQTRHKAFCGRIQQEDCRLQCS